MISQETYKLVWWLREQDLLTLSMTQLAGYCQRFGRSGRGAREELIERLYHIIWNEKYDQ